MIATPETRRLLEAIDKVEVSPLIRSFSLQDRCENLERRLTLCRNSMILVASTSMPFHRVESILNETLDLTATP